ncbi:MAG: hypothetical protein GQ582_00720 [Methyloprofundus sp.]|nr:hypothetical protein [Methyloprofundus sp.]
MALYAFDGTGNEDEAEDGKDSNVVKFKELYQPENPENIEYLAGVGIRMGTLGHVMGGLFGIGGFTRISEMYERLCENYAAGDEIIDIVGFSRGAAMAVHFANKLAEEQIILPDGRKVLAKIRFLGLWDVVASFGLSFNNILDFQEVNLGWDVKHIAECVDHCYHAMALDERRESFNITRLNPENKIGSITELWFRGVHSDIGGSNDNPLRSNIALNWMLDSARDCGLSFDEEKAKAAKYSQISLSAPVMQNQDVFTDPRRTIQATDSYHPSALPTLKLNESLNINVDSDKKYNWSGIQLEKDKQYRFEATGIWFDASIECDVTGWKTEILGWVKEELVKRFEDNRRCPEANWFELIGAYQDNDHSLFRLGGAADGIDITATETAPLWLFANDLSYKYGNNRGEISLKITRIA